MKKLSALVLLATCAAILLGASGEAKFPSMPAAVSGNAVVQRDPQQPGCPSSLRASTPVGSADTRSPRLSLIPPPHPVTRTGCDSRPDERGSPCGIRSASRAFEGCAASIGTPRVIVRAKPGLTGVSVRPPRTDQPVPSEREAREHDIAIIRPNRTQQLGSGNCRAQTLRQLTDDDGTTMSFPGD